MRRSGYADLPLHGGHAPRWLFERMIRLSRLIVEAILAERGADALLEMLSDPMWFQAFGSSIGFDWHSSGLTTTTLGALKIALNQAPSIGIFVAGGKGKTMLKTPKEIEKNRWLKVSPESLKLASKVAAKVDSAWIQDGYNIYHHTLIYTTDGRWVVIQQGMNEKNRYARRYHWIHTRLNTRLTLPHSGVEKSPNPEERVLNLTSPRSEETKTTILKFFTEQKPEGLLSDLKTLTNSKGLFMPRHHDVRINPSRLKPIILSTYENPPKTPVELAQTKLGPASIRALALVANLIYGTELDWTDPAIYSYAHGGKDGHPYPVNLQIYETTIDILSKVKAPTLEERRAVSRFLKRLYELYRVSK